MTAKKWRELNPNLAKNSNVRDYALINELTVLSNLESHNVELIKEGKEKLDRCRNLNPDDVKLKDVDEIKDIKIDRGKSNNERILDVIMNAKNLYIF